MDVFWTTKASTAGPQRSRRHHNGYFQSHHPPGTVFTGSYRLTSTSMVVDILDFAKVFWGVSGNSAQSVMFLSSTGWSGHSSSVFPYWALRTSADQSWGSCISMSVSMIMVCLEAKQASSGPVSCQKRTYPSAPHHHPHHRTRHRRPHRSPHPSCLAFQWPYHL